MGDLIKYKAYSYITFSGFWNGEISMAIAPH